MLNESLLITLKIITGDGLQLIASFVTSIMEPFVVFIKITINGLCYALCASVTSV